MIAKPHQYYIFTFVIVSFDCTVNKHGPQHAHCRQLWQQVMQQLSEHRYERRAAWNTCWAEVEGTPSQLVIIISKSC